MTTKKQKTFGDHLRDWLTPTMLFGAIVAGTWFASDFVSKSSEVQFDDSKQKLKVIEHTEEVPNAVDNYKQQQEIIKKSAKLDTVYNFALEVFENNTKNSEDAIRSRAARDSINQLMLLNTLRQQAIQQEQTEQIKIILRKLDSIK